MGILLDLFFHTNRNESMNGYKPGPSLNVEQRRDVTSHVYIIFIFILFIIITKRRRMNNKHKHREINALHVVSVFDVSVSFRALWSRLTSFSFQFIAQQKFYLISMKLDISGKMYH